MTALLLDDEHLLEAAGEAAHALGLERPGEADLVEAETDRRRVGVVDAELDERLAHIEIGLARGDDAEPRARAVEHDPVEAIGPREGVDGGQLRRSRRSCLERVYGPADVEAARRHLEILGERDLDAMRIDIDRGRAFDRLGDRLESDPAAGEARQREAIEAEIEKVLHRRGIEHGIAAAMKAYSL